MNKVSPPQSAFVTALAWTSIIVSALSVFVGFFQLVLVNVLFSEDLMQQLRADAPDDPFVQTLATWIPLLPWVFGLFFVVSAMSLVASIGLLKRREWGRRLFIALLVLGILWNVATFFGQQALMSAMPAVPQDAGAPPIEDFLGVFRIVSGTMVIALTVLLGWLAKRLMSRGIVAEFKH